MNSSLEISPPSAKAMAITLSSLAPFLTRTSGKALGFEKEAARHRKVLEILLKHLGETVPTSELVKPLQDFYKGRRWDALLKLLKNLEHNLGGLDFGGARFELVRIKGKGGGARLSRKSVEPQKAANRLFLIKDRVRHPLLGLDEANVIAWASGDKLNLSVRTNNSMITAITQKNVAELDEAIVTWISKNGHPISSYNSLLFGVAHLRTVGAVTNLRMSVSAMFHSWMLWTLGQQNLRAVVFDRKRVSAIARPLKVAIVVRVREGFVVGLRSEVNGIAQWRPTCLGMIEAACIDEVDKFDAGRIACLKLFEDTGYRCRAAEIRVLGCMELPIDEKDPYAGNSWTAPCLVCVLDAKGLEFTDTDVKKAPAGADLLRFETFKYIHEGRHVSGTGQGYAWTGTCWGPETAFAKAIDATANLHPCLRLVLAKAAAPSWRMEFSAK